MALGPLAALVRHPLWMAVAATAIGAGILAAIGLGFDALRAGDRQPPGGWWPPREVVYRCDGGHCPGADHVVFNSMVETSSYGDERAFVDARHVWMSAESHDRLDVRVGDEVIVRAYVDNNANPARVHEGDGTARETTLRFSLPLEAAKESLVEGVISAANASPPEVGDTAMLVAPEPIELAYVDGSARIFNSAFPAGFELDEGILEDGVRIGFEETPSRYCCQLNGAYPSCDPNPRAGCDTPGSVVEITVRVERPA